MKIYKCDECGMGVDGIQREEHGTQFRHIPCGGKWVEVKELDTKKEPDGLDEVDGDPKNDTL